MERYYNKQKLVHRYPVLGSSADPDKISATVKSIGVWLIPLIILIGKQFDVSFAEADLVNLINVTAAAIAAVMTVYGVARKLYYKYKK